MRTKLTNFERDITSVEAFKGHAQYQGYLAGGMQITGDGITIIVDFTENTYEIIISSANFSQDDTLSIQQWARTMNTFTNQKLIEQTIQDFRENISKALEIQKEIFAGA